MSGPGDDRPDQGGDRPGDRGDRPDPERPARAMRLDVGGATDTGRVRANNQDRYVIIEGLYAVADGMGGAAAGEVASQMAIDTLRAKLTAPTSEALVAAVGDANLALIDRSHEDPKVRGMGTTLCALLPVEGEHSLLALANVGDSRIYRFARGELEQISVDHKYVQDLVDAGQISADEATTHPQRNILTRALGLDPSLEVDSWEVAAFEGDRFVLCSDGLYDEVDDPGIAAVLRRLADPQEAAEELVRLAVEQGGHDNVTVVVVDVRDDGGRVEDATAALAADPARSNPASAPTGAVADRRVRPSGAGANGADEGGDRTTGTGPTADGAARRQRADRSVTQRSGLRLALSMVVGLMIVAVLFVGVVAWYARSGFFVGLDDDDQVAIFKGRPGGVLWFDPTLEESTDLGRTDLRPRQEELVLDGVEVRSMREARQVVDNYRELARPPASSTTTEAPPPQSPPTTSAPSTTRGA